MRNNIVSPGADELRYEIREIVAVAKEFARLGIEIVWENIGDPVQKGEKLPDWIKDLITEAMKEDLTYAYSPTKGLEATREFLAGLANRNGGVKITKEDIIFFNGLGDAISKVYGQLRRVYRVIGPSPAYSTHSSAEAAHAGSEYISYRLDPHNLWYPDLNDLRMKVKYNPSISGILVINPDNPTGAVYPKEILQEIVAIAKEYDLFILRHVSDAPMSGELRDRYTSDFQAALGANVRVLFERVESIPRAPTGKFLTAVSELGTGDPAPAASA